MASSMELNLCQYSTIQSSMQAHCIPCSMLHEVQYAMQCSVLHSMLHPVFHSMVHAMLYSMLHATLHVVPHSVFHSMPHAMLGCPEPLNAPDSSLGGVWYDIEHLPGSSRLGSTKHHLSDGIMARNAISTSNLVVSKNISRAMALWAGVAITVEREPEHRHG